MDSKPKSLTSKEYIIRLLAPKLLISEKIIDAVITHQFNGANAATIGNESIEISGFGKFLFNKKKAYKKMDKFLSQKKLFEFVIANPETSEQKRRSTNLKLSTVLNNIEILKPKLND
jgi:hypothetical protein